MPSRQVTIIGVMTWDESTSPIPPDPNAPRPSHPIMLPGMPGWGSGGPVDPGYSPPWAQVPPGTRPPTGPVDPGYSPPWAQVPPGSGPGGPVDPGYSPPWAQVRPPVDPGYSPPWAQVPPGTRPPTGPVDPGYSPPWAQVPPGTRPPTGPVDPGYSPPWAQVPDPNAPRPSHPIMLPGMPGWGSGGPVDPGYSPPWAQVPPGSGGWPGGGTPPEKPGFKPLGEGPIAGYSWYWSPVYGWLLGVAPSGGATPPVPTPPEGGTTPPPEGTTPPPEGTPPPTTP